MTETSSPLSRFVDIVYRLHIHEAGGSTRVIKEGTGNLVLGGVISELLGSEPAGSHFSNIEMTADYLRFLNMSLEAHKYIEANSRPKSLIVNLSHMDRISQILANSTVLSPGYIFMHGQQYSDDSMNSLLALSENLHPHNVETVIDRVGIDNLLAAVDIFLEVVQESNLDSLIKTKMIKLLTEIRGQVLVINIVGPETVLNSLDSLMGQSVRAIASAKTEDEQKIAVNVFTKGIVLMTSVAGVVDSAQKIWPVLQTAWDALKALTK